MERQQPSPIAPDEGAADNRDVRLLSEPPRAHPVHDSAAVGRQLHNLSVDKIEARSRGRSLYRIGRFLPGHHPEGKGDQRIGRQVRAIVLTASAGRQCLPALPLGIDQLLCEISH